MNPIKPMLAVPMSKANIIDWREWAIEEKFDGHRLIVEVAPSGVTAWTRPRKHAGDVSGKSMNTRELPAHLAQALSALPAGVYDGELLGGETSTDVTRTDLAHTLRFVVFDVLRFGQANHSCVTDPYEQRRVILERLTFKSDTVFLAESRNVTCQDDVTSFVELVWRRGGEGAILKRKKAPYQPGKRSADFVKVKKLLTTVCTVVGFEATRGKVMNRGAFATVILEDAQGHRTSVKTKDDAELAAFENALKRNARLGPLPIEQHPAIGRKLRIEYQDIAADGGYRHPRWDRWEDE